MVGYYINVRMDEARRLLRETKKSVADVGLDVGHANPSHFARAFRKETGLSSERLPPAALSARLVAAFKLREALHILR